MILAASYVIGEIESVEPLPVGSDLADYVVSVSTDSGVRSFSLDNPAHKALPKVHDGRKLILFSDGVAEGVDGGRIQWSPSIGVFDGERSDVATVEQDIRAAKSAAASFLDRNTECPRKIEKSLSRLDGSQQQKAIDMLFSSLPFGSSEFACVTRAIGSSSKLTVGSFRPPYSSREGVYHHGLHTRGELITILLPHMTNYSIYISGSTLDEKLRKKMIEAWAYWGSEVYVIQ